MTEADYPETVTIPGWSEPRAMCSWRYAYDSGLVHYLDIIVNDAEDTMTLNVASPLLEEHRLIWLDICEPDKRHDKYIRHPERRALAQEFRNGLTVPF